MKEIIFAIPYIILLSFSNIVLKWRINFLTDQGIRLFSEKYIKFLLDPFIILGGIAAILSITWWFKIISSFRISTIYPITQVGVILTITISSIVFLNENVPIKNFLAIALMSLSFILFAI